MFAVKRLELGDDEPKHSTNNKSMKRKAESSSSSDSSSDSDAPSQTRKPVPTPAKAQQKTPAKKPTSSSSASSSSSSDSDVPQIKRKSAAPAKSQLQTKKAASSSSSSSSSSDSSDSDSDASPRKKQKVAPAPAPAVPFKPVSDTMFGQYGFVLPSGAPPTEASLAKEAQERQAMLDAAAAARRAALQPPSTASTAPPPKLKTLSAKQAASLTKVAKLNAAQAAKLDKDELETYRLARAEDKRAKKLARRELQTPEERQAAKAEARKQRKEQAREAMKKKEATAATEAAPAAEPVKAPKPPKVVAPVIPSSSAATNPALRSEGLKKKDESVRAQERAERKRARREALGLPPEEEEPAVEEKKEDQTSDAQSATTETQVDHSAESLSHKRKLDAMRDARMQAVSEREARDPLKQAMRGSAKEEEGKENLNPNVKKLPQEDDARPEVSIKSLGTAPSSSEALAQFHAKPLWMLRGRQISALSSVAVEDFRLDERIKKVLTKQMGIDRFFATQSELLPVILKSYGINDICCCAPTGSGKTLAYIIPLVQSLAKRIVVRLRALILLPSRDLALQVLKVLQPFAQVLGLKVECILGQSSFEQEKSKLIGWDSHGRPESLVDILICTPGRLMDHLAAATESQSTTTQRSYGFHLRDLQYLIIDEIDRLLTQNYQDWPGKILGHIYENSSASSVSSSHSRFSITGQFSVCEDELLVHETHARRRLVRGATTAPAAPVIPSSGEDVDSASITPTTIRTRHLPLQKLLFSATLTNNPQKLASLQLSNPLFFTESTSAKKKFQLPLTLKSWILNLADTVQKPLVLIHLLLELEKKESRTKALAQDMETDGDGNGTKSSSTTQGNQILIFTSSIESTHRLYRLLELYNGGQTFPNIAEFSSALSQKERNKILQRFKRGECKIIICSDAMSRGMDLSNIDTVINYDVPQFIQTYVHRVGRTARAGSSGQAYTMVKAAQFRNFKSLLHQADNSFYSVFPTVSDEVTRPLMKKYQQGLAELKNVLLLEKQGEQHAHQPITSALRSRVSAAAVASLASASGTLDDADGDLENATDSKGVDADGDATMEDAADAKIAETKMQFSKREKMPESSRLERPKSKKVKL